MKQIETFNPKVRELLKFTVLQYMLDALNENPKLGKIFVDDVDNPNTCVVSFHHLLFFGGNLTQDFRKFLLDELLAEDVRKDQCVFFMLYPDEAWKNALNGLFPNKCNQYERSLYRWKYGSVCNLSCCNNIVEITSNLMNSDVGNLDMIINEVIPTGTYDNIDDFLSRGIGYVPVINNKVCGFCTSEYPSRSAVAIGIEVLEEYQRQGYAKAMTKAFLNKASKRDLIVYWECWKNNIASAKTALSCGFEKVADYPILFVNL